MMANHLSITSFLMMCFMCLLNIEYGSCLLFHSHVNNTPTDQNSISSDSSTIHQLLSKQMSYMENTVRLLTEKVSNLEKNRSDADIEIAHLKRKLKVTEQQNSEISQRLTSLELICNSTNTVNQNWNLQEERLKRIESDVSNTVLLTRTLAVNGERDRNRTLNNEKTVSVLKDELRNVHLFLVQESIKSEKINSTLEWHINESTLNIQRVLDEIRDNNNTIKKMVSDIRQGRLVSQNFVNSINKLESNVHDIQNHVGFTAVLTNPKTWNGGSTLLFDKLIYSTGGGYDTTTGVFTSPVSGMFVFYLAFVSQSNFDVYLDIMLNGAEKVTSLSLHQTGTNLAFLHLQTGDRVWIKNHNGGIFYVYAHVPLITFSGFRL